MTEFYKIRQLAFCVLTGFARNPALALANVGTLRLRDAKTWRRFSLKIHGRKFLEDFYAASQLSGIRPFLMWGTLLGIVRDGGLMPHDIDIDVAILSGDYAKKDRLIGEMRRRGYRLRLDIPYKLRFRRRDGLHLDVDVFYPWKAEVIATADWGDRPIYGSHFPRAAFAKLRGATILGDIEVLIPDPPEPVLEAIYGSWQTPDPSYRSDRPGTALHWPRDAPPPPFDELFEGP